jgi:hypothetical protein
MSGILSKGITLNSYTVPVDVDVDVPIADLQEIPDLGASIEKVEVTVLADGSKKYIQGIKEYSDLEFIFLYDNGVNGCYRTIKDFEDVGLVTLWKVIFPDTTEFKFSASVSTVIAGASVGDALTFTAMFTLASEIEVVNPTV